MGHTEVEEPTFFEMDMIKKDTLFYTNLLSTISGKEESSTLIFGLYPYITLLVVESIDYNQTRLHQSLDYHTPAEVYGGQVQLTH